MRRVAKGFTLIEVMITIAIIGIAMSIALPQYRDYVTRTRVTEAFSGLQGVQPAAEQFWSNNRTYVAFDRLPTSVNFTYALSGATTSAYTVTATGTGPVNGFVYTINQNGVRATTASPTGWGTSTSCWVDHKGGACTQ